MAGSWPVALRVSAGAHGLAALALVQRWLRKQQAARFSKALAPGKVAGGGTAYWRWRRTHEAPALPVASNRDVNLDIGERVFVQEWAPNRTARVQYRGSPWEARLAPGAPAAAGEHRVSAVEGNWLVLEPAAPRQ